MQNKYGNSSISAPLDNSFYPTPEAPTPEIRIDIAPPEINIDFSPPSQQPNRDVNALDAPDRSRSRNRIRAKSDEFNTSMRLTSDSRDRIRAKSASSIPHRDYILDLADPTRLSSIPEGDELRPKRLQKHPATFQCSLCPKRFTRAYNLRSHLRTHGDEQPFVCSVCGKAFARQHDRKRHEGLHSGEKKFVCRGALKDGSNWGCGRRFARADALGRHFRSEAGRFCIKPLVEEEIQNEKGLDTTAFTPDIPKSLFDPFSQSPAGGVPVSEQERQQQKKRKIEAIDAMGPPSLDFKPSPVTLSLPSALLAQYPALAGISWDQTPLDSSNDFNDSGYSGSSSFDASTSSEDYHENEAYASHSSLFGSMAPPPQKSLAPNDSQLPPWTSENEANQSRGHEHGLLQASEVAKLDDFFAQGVRVPEVGRPEVSLVPEYHDRVDAVMLQGMLPGGDNASNLPRDVPTDLVTPESSMDPRSTSAVSHDSTLDLPAGAPFHARSNDRSFDLHSRSNQSTGDSQSCPDFHTQLLRGNNDSLSQPLPSDSGYQSGLGTDTESICSLGSVGSSLGLPQNFLQEFIAFFGGVLIEKAGARAWAGYAMAHHSSDKIQQQLNVLLKRFTEDLSTALQPSPQASRDIHLLEGATRLIRRYRPKIARYFCDNAVSHSVTADSLTSRLHALSKQLSLTEKLGLLDKVTSSNCDLTEVANDIPTDEEVDELFTDIEGIRKLLVSSEAFEHLAAELRRTLYSGDEQVMNRIQATVRNGLMGLSTITNLHRAIFLVQWSVPSFMKSQYEVEGTRVGSAVALCGSVLYAQATTCLEYAKTVWPSNGSDFIRAMEAMLKAGEFGLQESGAEYEGIRWRLSPAPSHRDDDTTSSWQVSAEGSIDRLVELAQQLAWIGSTLSSSPYGEELAYCKPILNLQPSALGRTFNLGFEHQRLHPTEDACWLPMFCGASIAHGFPIPERGEETGLEIPLSLMAGIAGVRHAVEYEGGVVMKGFSTLFVPTKKASNRVQWHLISSRGADVRLSYREGLQHCGSRLLTEKFDLAQLGQHRAIVGWCTSAASLLGSKSANYENIDYSGAEDADTQLKFAGGTLGFQQIGVAQLDFTLGAKDGKSHFQRSGPFRNIVSAASRTPVVLFDTSERRAWLVPASSVMLHIAQHRHWLEPFEVNGKRIDFLSTGSDSSSAREVLLKNAATSLSDYEEYTFKDLILNIWSVLEFLIDQNVIREQSTPGAAVKGTLRESISGFEFKAVVQERSPYRQKQVMIRKTCGGWPMLARDIDALVLFANGFEDLIRPQQNGTEDLCSLWRSVPKWKDYLATSISTIKDLYDFAGSRLDRKYLTSTRLQWDRGDSAIFEACRSPGSYRCRCNRLQQIVPKSSIGRIVPPGQLVDDGAIIFGHSGNLIREAMSKTIPQVQAPSGLYSQPNISLTPITILPDPEDAGSVTSDDEPAGRSGSDTTIESFSSSATSFATREGVTSTLEDLKIDPSENPRPKKRVWNETGSKPPSRGDATPKRLKYGQYLHPDSSSFSDEGSEFGVCPIPESASSERKHSRHDSRA